MQIAFDSGNCEVCKQPRSRPPAYRGLYGSDENGWPLICQSGHMDSEKILRAIRMYLDEFPKCSISAIAWLTRSTFSRAAREHPKIVSKIVNELVMKEIRARGRRNRGCPGGASDQANNPGLREDLPARRQEQQGEMDRPDQNMQED